MAKKLSVLDSDPLNKVFVTYHVTAHNRFGMLLTSMRLPVDVDTDELACAAVQDLAAHPEQIFFPQKEAGKRLTYLRLERREFLVRIPSRPVRTIRTTKAKGVKK